MIAEADEGVLDMRPEAGQAHANFDRTLRIGRLQTLECYGLATQSEPGLWALSERLEAIMRDLGERNDIIKAINRALADPGEERAPGSFVPPGEAQTPITGRVIDKRLIDELGDRIGLIIDGIDGRVHHVAFRDPSAVEEAKIGAIVEVSRTPSQRPADRNIAIVATGTGVYRPSAHRKMLEAASARTRGGDYEAFVDTHRGAWRRCDAPALSSGPAPIAGSSQRTSRFAPEPTMLAGAVRRAYASSPAAILTSK